MEAYISGWGHSPFGKSEKDVETLLGNVAKDALNHAGLDASEIDGVYLGWFNAGFSDQSFGSSLVFNALPDLRFKPATRVENACATGSAAIHSALDAIESGRMRNVLVVGVEKMTERSGPEIGRLLQKASYLPEESEIEGGFAGIFGVIAQNYFQAFGDQSRALAKIAAKNHQNGVLNPLAHMRKDFDEDFCFHPSEKNPYVAGPLKRTDCSLVSDGAAALVLSAEKLTDSHIPQIRFKARAQVNDYLPMSKRDMTYFEAIERVWKDSLGQGGLKLDDLDFVETHDCFTIAELMQYEAMGLAKKGQGFRVLEEGQTLPSGRLPVNLSGGLKSKGHPIGATGISMHVMSAMQLAGRASGASIDNPRLGAVFNMGGAGVANYCSILERQD